ncbi:hypothetical protein IRY61_04795 [Candidatus Saccharibacteria bacterium]|nr:hypothetical protein [Candidatus Saccharibacteria bacterium]
MNKFKTIISGVAAGIILTIGAVASASGAASFSISGNGSSHTLGSNFTVTISESSGALEANTVAVSLRYDTAKLKVVSIAAGDFPTCVTMKDLGGGIIKFECTALGGKLTGTHPVGIVTFTAMDTGTVQFTTLADAAILDTGTPANDVWNGAIAAASHSIVEAPAPEPSAPITKRTNTATTTTTAAVDSETTEEPTTTSLDPSNLEVYEPTKFADATGKSSLNISMIVLWVLSVVLAGLLGIYYQQRIDRQKIFQAQAAAAQRQQKIKKAAKTRKSKASNSR